MNLTLLNTIHQDLYRWSKRHTDSLARPYCRVVEKKYGRKNWYSIKKYLEESGTITKVESARFYTSILNPKEKRKGVTAGYKVSAPIANCRQFVPTSEFGVRYGETVSRSNISTAVYVSHGHGIDTRNYTNYSAMSQYDKARVTIDSEETSEVDISNAFYLGIIEYFIKKNISVEQSFVDHVMNGTLVKAISEESNVGKNIVKIALLRLTNMKKNLRSNDLSVALVEEVFKILFPIAFVQLRKLGAASLSWKIGNMWEGRVRNLILKKAYTALGYQPLDCHDGFRVKSSDVHTLVSIMLNVQQMPLKVNGQTLNAFYSSTLSLPFSPVSPISVHGGKEGEHPYPPDPLL